MDKKRIKEQINKLVDSEGFFFIELLIRGENKNPVIEVFVDNEAGITTKDCKVLSQKIIEMLETDNLVGEKLRLDVSSPGIERPLIFPGQYKKHSGRKLEVTYLSEEKEVVLTGKLNLVDESKIQIESESGSTEINFENIKNAKVLISF